MCVKMILVKLLSADQKSLEDNTIAERQILCLKQENANLQSEVIINFGFALLCF